MKYQSAVLLLILCLALCFGFFVSPSITYATTGSASCRVGSEASDLGFNPFNDYVYVSFGFTSDTISFVSSPCLVVSSTSAIAGCPFAMAYNPNNELMYVSDGCNNSIVLVKGTSVVGSIVGPKITNPSGILYDPRTKLMYVGIENGMDAINGTTVVSSLSIPGFVPTGLAYSEASNQIFAISGGNSNVEIIGDSCFCVQGQLNIAHGATGIVYDSANAYIYISQYESNTRNRTGSVVVISSASHSIVATIGVGRHPDDVAYSPRTGEVYVSNFLPTAGSTGISIIKGERVSMTLDLKGAPTELLFDPYNGLVYASLWNTGELATIVE